MIKLDFTVSNLSILSKCLSFSDISKDVNWLNIYSKDGRILMASGEKIRVVVDTLISTESDVDICVDCRKLIEYVNYLKGFEKEGVCSLLIKDNGLQIKNDTKNKIKNNLYLEYMLEDVPKIRAKNFNEITTISPEIMKDGVGFVAIGADGSEKYSSQVPSVLINSTKTKLYLAGTDSVKCCICKLDIEAEEEHAVIIPPNIARAISNIAALLNKDASLGYSSSYFKCNFGNVAIYSSKINTDFPPLDPLFEITGSCISIERAKFVNVLRGATIASKGKQDNKITIAVVGNILRVYSAEFDVSLELDNAVIGENIEVPLNIIFLYSMCVLFKTENINLQFNKSVIKISDDVGIRTVFVATLK